MNTFVKNNGNMIEFINDLDLLSYECEDFFDYRLLSLLEKHFQFVNVGITAYNEGKYIGCLGQQRAATLAEHHTNYFHKRDALSHYITSSKTKLLQTQSPIILITDLYTNDEYTNSEYFEFLKIAGLEYVAVMVMDNYRICLYKEVGEGNFNRGELHAISHLYTIIRNKYLIHQKIRDKVLLNQNQMIGLDIANNGYFLFDSLGNILEYNQNAVRYATKVFKTDNIREVYFEILNLMDSEIQSGANKIVKRHGDYVFTMKIESIINNFGHVRKYYNIIIKENIREEISYKAPCAETLGIEPENLNKSFAELTERELEVLDVFAKGSDYNEISEQLFISENTVRSHLKNIYRKLDVNNQRTLVHLYFQYKYILNSEVST